MRFTVIVLLLLASILGASCSKSGIEATPQQSISYNIGDKVVSVEPGPGSVLLDSEDKSSKVVLEEVLAGTGTAETDYFSQWYPQHTVRVGERIVLIRGTVRNDHEANKEIALYARGYDQAREQVGWTLDASHTLGQIGLHLNKGETGQFVLHMNFSHDTTCIRIFASSYALAPP